MSYNVNELDNRVKEYLSAGQQEADAWRRTKVAISGGKLSGKRRLPGMIHRAASLTAGAASQLARGLRTWIRRLSQPQEECC